jgi:hypothetical protein
MGFGAVEVSNIPSRFIIRNPRKPFDDPPGEVIKGLKIESACTKISPRPSLPKRGTFPPFGKGGEEGFYKTVSLLL